MGEDFKVWRGGVTANYSQEEEQTLATIKPDVVSGSVGVSLSFCIASKGGGTTFVRVVIPREKFVKLRKAMDFAEEVVEVQETKHFGNMIAMGERLKNWNGE